MATFGDFTGAGSNIGLLILRANSIILSFYNFVLLISCHSDDRKYKIRKKFQALRFAVESGYGAAPGAFVRDVSRDHLGALPAAGRH